jgi:ABC-type proline/glycine betaine transport system ATPase subunit
MLAGFERPTRDRLPPYERNIAMVFQDYALFPHMTVGEDVAFPLNVRRIPRNRIAERVRRAWAMVRLEDYAERRPAQRPMQMFVGLREHLDPTITAAATLMMLLSILLLVVADRLRQRG